MLQSHFVFIPQHWIHLIKSTHLSRTIIIYFDSWAVAKLSCGKCAMDSMHKFWVRALLTMKSEK